MTTEEKLAQALRTIADRAENQDVLSGVMAKRRRRRRRKAKGTLVAVCAVALGWSAMIAWPAPHVVVDPAVSRPEENAVERVWPRAVFTVPGRSRPLAAISATELLLWDERGTLQIYDAASERSRTVAVLREAPQYLAVDRERVVWLAGGQAWVAPLRAGGQARKVGPIPGQNVDRLALAGRDIIWSAPLDGVWRMRIDGGVPERVPGSKGLQLVEWPWATDEPLNVRTNPTEVVNLQTGDIIKVRPAAGVEGLRCGPTWCSGTRGDDTVVQRSDGGWSAVRQGLRGYPYRDRFFAGSGDIYDARTRTTVTFEGARLPSGGREWSSGSGVIFWRQDGGVRVVNLIAIAGAPVGNGS